MKYKILIVDDEPANLRMLERLFGQDNEVITAESGVEALEMLSRYDAALIISDQRMPGMTGIEFLKQAAVLRQQTVRIILTGYTDVADLIDGINSGVIYKYITKPWVNTDLCQTVQRALEHYDLAKARSCLAMENGRLKDRLGTTVQGFVSSIKEMIVQKSPQLGEHCRRTSEYAALIARRFGLERDDIEQLTLASILHEAPNIRIPFEMGFKKSALTAEQYRVTRNNYDNALRFISGVPDLENVAEIIRYQHEHYDGTGLFDGLDGERIPYLSRILAVANALDEINLGRSPAFFSTDERVAEWLQNRSGTQFDPRVVDMYLKSTFPESVGPADIALESNEPVQVVSTAVR